MIQAAEQENAQRFSEWNEGNATRAWHFLGAHPACREGAEGWLFRVWAPNARAVAVTGDFCHWSESGAPMVRLEGGIWEGFVPGLQGYDAYKSAVTGADGVVRLKADPFAFHAETRPATASKLYDLSGYTWHDQSWMKWRKKHLV